MERPAKKRKIVASTKKGAPIPVEMISCNNSERIHFHLITLSGSEPPMKIFMESDRVFTSIMLENVKLVKDHILFWKKTGKFFTELIIKNCPILASDFILILKNLNNLTKLVILDSLTFCKDLAFEIKKENKDLFISASKLTSFIIDESWRNLESDVFSQWLSKMPKITEFDFSMIDVEEDLFIVDCVKLWENQLTALRLKNTISVETRNKIYDLKISKLEVFQIGSPDTETELYYLNDERECDGDDGKSLLEFVSRQTNLQEFIVGICNVDEDFMVKLYENAPNLKNLGVYNSSNLEDIKNSKVLALYGRLTKLDLYAFCFYALIDCSYITNLTHLKFYQPVKDEDTRDYRRYYDIPFSSMHELINLTSLDVNDDYICGVDIQIILCNLIELEVLRVNTKHTLTDFAFSGKGLQYPKTEKYTQYSYTGHCKGPFYQLGRLKKLIELDIQSQDAKFTDFALDRISKLKQLRILNLINYKKVTISGIDKVVTSCKKLEQINISGCKLKIANEIASNFKKRAVKVIYEKVELLDTYPLY